MIAMMHVLTFNVPVVYMARDVMILKRAISITWAIQMALVMDIACFKIITSRAI